MNGEIVHYEIPAGNLKKLSGFYSKVFGWKFRDSGMTSMKYFVIDMARNRPAGFLVSGGMYDSKRKGKPISYIGTPNIDATVRKFVSSGGKITHKKALVPGMGWSAQGVDPEGNNVGMFQALPRSKATDSKSRR